MKVNATITMPDGNKIFAIDDFFPVALTRELLTVFTDSHGWKSGDQFNHYNGRQIHTQDHPIKSHIRDHARDAAQTIGTILGYDVVYLEHVALWKDDPEYAITPHLDPGQLGIVTVQIYVGENVTSAGTTLYNGKSPVVTLAYNNNAGYLTDAPDRIMHGLIHTGPSGRHRYSVYMRYQRT